MTKTARRNCIEACLRSEADAPRLRSAGSAFPRARRRPLFFREQNGALDSGRERSIKMERQAASRRRAVAHPRVRNDERRSTCALRNGSPADIDSQARDALSLGRESRVEAAWKPRGSRVEGANPSLALEVEIYGATRGALNQKQYFCAARLGSKVQVCGGPRMIPPRLRRGKRK